MAVKQDTVYLIRNDYNPLEDGSRPPNIAFDLTEITPTLSSTLATYRTQKNILTNNIRKNPITINLTGTVSVTPITHYENNLFDYVNLPNRDVRAYNTIYDLWDNETLLTLVYRYDIFENLVIKSITPRRDGANIVFDLTLEQILFASYRRVTLIGNGTESNMDEKKERDSQGNTTSGDQQNQEEDREWQTKQEIDRFKDSLGLGDLDDLLGTNLADIQIPYAPR